MKKLRWSITIVIFSIITIITTLWLTGVIPMEIAKISINYDFINGHLDISCCGSLSLCSIEYREAVESRKAEILKFCNKI